MTQISIAKTVLARLLATENLAVRHWSGKTAAIDLKARTVYLPIWENISDDMYDLMVGHEVGHALFTPENGWHSKEHPKGKVFKGYLNITEDSRIEKKVCQKYRGLKRSFIAGYREFLARDFFGINKLNGDLTSLTLIDRLNIYAKVGTEVVVPFKDEELVYVARLENLETFADAEKLALDLFELSKNAAEDESKEGEKKSKLGDSDEDQDGEVSESDSEDDGDETESEEKGEEKKSDKKPNGKADKKDKDGDEKGNTEGEEKKKEEKKPKEKSKDPAHGSGSEASTDSAFEKAMEKFNEQNTSSTVTSQRAITLPTKNVFDYTSRILSHDMVLEAMRNSAGGSQIGMGNYKPFVDDNKLIINNYVNAFNAKKQAKSYQKTRVDRSGRVDPLRLVNYKISEDIFASNEVVFNDKSHGFAVLIDLSGSMSGVIKNVFKQAAILACFMRQVGINYRFYGFSDQRMDYLPNAMMSGKFSAWKAARKNHSSTNLNVNEFQLLEFFSSDQTVAQHQEMVGLLTRDTTNQHYPSQIMPFTMCGTPLVHGLMALHQIAPKMKEDMNIDIMNVVLFTDGGDGSLDPFNVCNGSYYDNGEQSAMHTFIDPITKISVDVSFVAYNKKDKHSCGYFTVSGRKNKYMSKRTAEVSAVMILMKNAYPFIRTSNFFFMENEFDKANQTMIGTKINTTGFTREQWKNHRGVQNLETTMKNSIGEIESTIKFVSFEDNLAVIDSQYSAYDREFFIHIEKEKDYLANKDFTSKNGGVRFGSLATNFMKTATSSVASRNLATRFIDLVA